MTLSLEIVNMATEERREVMINRRDEYLEFTLVNGAGEPVIIRQWLGDFTTWLGVDGYGQPGAVDNQATQLKLDVHHMDMTPEHEHYDEEMPPHPYVQVQTAMFQDDPPLHFLTKMRLLEQDDAIKALEWKLRQYKQRDMTDRAALSEMEDILSRVKSEGR